MMKTFLKSLVFVLGTVGAWSRVSFQGTCVRKVSAFQDGDLRAQEYPGVLSDLTLGRIDETNIFKRLPRRMILVFNLLSSTGDRASIPTGTAGDCLRTCQILEESMHQLGLLPSLAELEALDEKAESDVCWSATSGNRANETSSLGSVNETKRAEESCANGDRCEESEVPHSAWFTTSN